MKVKKQVFSRLGNIFEQIREYQNLDDDLSIIDDDVNYMNKVIGFLP
jgi:hypothetical protein